MIGLSTWANHVVRATGPRSCETELELCFSGLLAPLVAVFVGKLTQRYIANEASSLKALAESRAVQREGSSLVI